MTSKEIVQKFIKFYRDREHTEISNVSLVPENDPTLLFVNSGMFPLVPYLFGEKHPQGKRLVNIQRCLRFEDIEEVGDSNRHTVAFHMLGNWSLGDYFKEDQLTWVYKFFVEVLELDVNRMHASVFAGDQDAPVDAKSIRVLKKIFANYGIEAREGERIYLYGKGDNWWSRGDAIGEPGGPDSEIFYYIGSEGTGEGKNPVKNQDEFIEIGNSVFMQYRSVGGGWEELGQRNVDFGGGLERIALAVQKKQDIFETDNFLPIIEQIEVLSGKKYGNDEKLTKNMRKIADHMRAAVLITMDGVVPSNKDRGYILRRIVRRMSRAGRRLDLETGFSVELVKSVVDTLSWLYPKLSEKQSEIEIILGEEEEKFSRTLSKGGKAFKKIKPSLEVGNHSEVAKVGFNLYQSLGYPPEMFFEDIRDLGASDQDLIEINEQLNARIIDHKTLSREGAEKKFNGGLADHSEQVVKYHTTTHLLHWALREVLGEKVKQRGSNITGERLRFDFSHDEKLTDEQLGKVEKLINEKVNEELPVRFETMSKKEAGALGVLSFFEEKYGGDVKVYYIGKDLKTAFSKELCGGPHVKNTNELNKIEIYKQEKVGKNTVRVYLKKR